MTTRIIKEADNLYHLYVKSADVWMTDQQVEELITILKNRDKV